MESQAHYQDTFEKKLIVGALLFTYPIYAIGGLYITGSVLGWTVLALVALRAFIEGENSFTGIPVLVWLWIIGMLVMLISLWVAHEQWSLGSTQTIKSTVGWTKGWALLGLFPMLGAIVKLKPEVLIRAVCIVAKHSAIFGVVTWLLYMTGLPGKLFISPLQILGGSGENFFMVSLYQTNPEVAAGRWQFFAPWATAAGLLSCLFVIFCLQEKDKNYRNWGLTGCIVMALLSQSRAGWAIFIVIVPTYMLASQVNKPWLLIAFGLLLPIILVLGEPLYESVINIYQQVKEARPASTRVRAALENLAIQRWRDEAPIWGHGIVESGPKIVEFMPIGSHHSWYGLLFVKGLVGFFALAIPMILSTLYLLIFAHSSIQARSALCMLLIIISYSFFENLEILAYLYWPALFWIGMVLKNLQGRGQHV
ncbi:MULTISPECIES: O-antigen ligase family protein [unclassified Colwellia]|uniref:O-antigen ligase family protein n=1 Tax=unclassified Colwellia TaxID=196834 RepID=UPI0015F474A7|nr:MULTISPECIES: O-antigen ligase family protein [unclassified Colwellia]MBA6232949.1 O-antigen ligase family protein [Colwellia sp. MB02u-7]MBA6237083.1 O-antigen ligase family protein [Colwellia sp. MB02u-11]MBA6299438.1 O-antigen ligase family protein [Colwellia sp. MB3u-22]MBA6311538.1 O-antigen ligase family protein [Colwellia sp. MB3u-64]